MPAARRTTEDNSFWGTLVRFVPPLRIISPGLILGVLVVVVFGGGVYTLWRWIGHKIEADDSYLVTPEKIEISRQPDWICSDVKTDVAKAALAQPQDLRDRDLTVRMAREFTLNPWVASVRRVSKAYPEGVTVDLQYRKPVAIVQVLSAEGTPSVLLVDANGVLLPTKECPKEKVMALPRIYVGDTWPSGAAGSPWGDKRVHAGTTIAAELSEHWKKLGLRRIQLAEDDTGGVAFDEPSFELITQKGVRVLWGHRPGAEVGREPASAVKIRRLLDFVEKQGPLDPPEDNGAGMVSPPRIVDLRNPGGVKVYNAPTASRAFVPF